MQSTVTYYRQSPEQTQVFAPGIRDAWWRRPQEGGKKSLAAASFIG
jgi:hypothetical protein